jgi:hypothetical protein
MYDEFERAVTGKNKQGIPVFGWILIVLAFLFLFGIVGVGFAAHRVSRVIHREVSTEISAELARELGDLDGELAAGLKGLDAGVAAEVAAALAEVEAELGGELRGESRVMAADFLARLRPRFERLMGDPDAGMALLQDLGSSTTSEKALKDVLEGSLRIRTHDGELTAKLWSGEDGGSLVIEGPDGDVQVDLVKEDGGGELVIRSEEKVVRFGAGTAAAGLPGWVPRVRGMPDDPKHLFSALSEEGSLGAVSWDTDRSPRAVLDFYRRELREAGYEIREEHSEWKRGDVEGGFWAESDADGRMVFMAVSEEDGGTKVILGYGEEGS